MTKSYRPGLSEGEYLKPILLYIDPGTGSMLFTIIIGAVSVVYLSYRNLN